MATSNCGYLARSTPIFLFVVLLTLPLRFLSAAPDVKGFVAAKGRVYTQTNSGPPHLLAEPIFVPGLHIDAPFIFGAVVWPESPSSVNSVTLTPPSGVATNMPWAAASFSADAFRVSAGFQTQIALDAVFRDGSYFFAIDSVHDGKRGVAAMLPADSYPTAPRIANFDAAQRINAAAEFTIVWDAFNGGTESDFIKLEIDNPTGGLLIGSPDLLQPRMLTGTATSFVVPANTLLIGRAYTARLQFWKTRMVYPSSYPGVVGAGVYAAKTEFVIRTTGESPMPDTWYFLVGKAQVFQQPGSEMPVPDPANPYASIALLRSTATGAITTASFQTPGGITKALLQLSSDLRTFRTQEVFAVESALDAAYSTGTYTATVNTAHDGLRSLPLYIGPGSYPAAPQFSNVNQAQTINPSNTFRLTWHPLPEGSTEDYVQVDIMDAQHNSLKTSPGFLMEDALDGTSTFFDIPEGTLAGSNVYTATILLARGTATNFASYEGVVGYAAYAAQTRCAIATFPAPTAPTLSQQPQSRTNTVGTLAILNVAATGTAPLSYQWWMEDRALEGATNSTLALLSVQTDHAGNYRVVVANSAGSVTSAVAILTVVAPPPGAGFTNTVLALDGNYSSYVSVPGSPDLQNSDAITIEFWLCPTPQPRRHYRPLNKGDGAGDVTARTFDFDWVTDNGGTIGVEFFWDPLPDAPNYHGLGAAAPGNCWTHVAASFDSQADLIQLYTNGILAAQQSGLAGSLSIRRTLRQTALPLIIGGAYPAYCDCGFAGYLDEVRIWTIARTGEQIRNSMRSRLMGGEPGLAGYWNFDDGSLADITGHGHNGAVNGNAAVSPIFGNDQIHAAKFLPGTRRTDSVTWLSFELATNASHFLQASPDLANWTNIAVVVGTNSPFEFTDESAGSLGKRFYRLLRP